MHLLLDFGNTHVKAALMQDDSMHVIYCGPASVDALVGALQGGQIEGGMWCSVHPLARELTDWMESLHLVQLTACTPIPISNDYATPHTLGMDRLAAAVGAWSIKPGHDLLIIDAGTAITYDFVSSRGEYKGGNITPGIDLRFKALHEFTGALPLVGAEGRTPMFGNDTQSAIRCGVLNGINNELDGYVAKLTTLYPSLLIFLTGGSARYFDIKAKKATFAVPNLVLHGLAQILKHNEKVI